MLPACINSPPRPWPAPYAWLRYDQSILTWSEETEKWGEQEPETVKVADLRACKKLCTEKGCSAIEYHNRWKTCEIHYQYPSRVDTTDPGCDKSKCMLKTYINSATTEVRTSCAKWGFFGCKQWNYETIELPFAVQFDKSNCIQDGLTPITSKSVCKAVWQVAKDDLIEFGSTSGDAFSGTGLLSGLSEIGGCTFQRRSESAKFNGIVPVSGYLSGRLQNDEDSSRGFNAAICAVFPDGEFDIEGEEAAGAVVAAQSSTASSANIAIIATVAAVVAIAVVAAVVLVGRRRSASATVELEWVDEAETTSTTI